MSETMEAPVIVGIPRTYAIAARPKPAPRQSTLDPQIVNDLQETLRSGEALAFPVDGYPELQVNRLASRLTNIGRRSRNFAVRTRKGDGQLYAWAVVRSPEAPRRKREKQTALPLTTTTTGAVR